MPSFRPVQGKFSCFQWDILYMSLLRFGHTATQLFSCFSMSCPVEFRLYVLLLLFVLSKFHESGVRETHFIFLINRPKNPALVLCCPAQPSKR